MLVTPGQVASSFVAPALAGAGAAAVAIPIAIHLLSRLRRRPQRWAAMRFLLEAFRRHKQRLRFENWLLLLVRCLIVLALGLALSGPLLTGCAGRLTGALDVTPRHIHIVLDDSLSTRAAESAEATRFDRLRDTAKRLVESARPEDRVQLWLAARPAQRADGVEPTSHATAIAALNNATPRYSRSNLVEALDNVSAELDDAAVAPDHAAVVILSDFPRAADYLDRPAPQQLADLGVRARLLAARPHVGSDNVQVYSVAPRRVVVLAEETAATLPVEVQVRRFGGGAAESLRVEVAAIDDRGRVVAAATRQPRWAVGQSVARISLDLPLTTLSWSARGGVDHSDSRMLVLRAALEAGAGSDALAEDDAAFSVVDVRRRLRVGLIDEPPGDARGQLTPARWVELALSPRGASADGPVQVVPISYAEVDADPAVSGLAMVDAVIVMRPDLLGAPAWSRLGAFARNGGLVWVITPSGDAPATWANHVTDTFGLPWRVGLNAVTPEGEDADESHINLDMDARPPPALGVLAADWETLLRPIHVTRRLPIDAPDQDIYISVSPAAGDAVLLAAREVGDGAVLLLGAALDPDWTNLPTKPLFVPLLHETLRGLLAQVRREALSPVTAGDRPALGRAWRGAGRLVPFLELDDRESREIEPITLMVEGDRIMPAAVLADPGVYRAGEGSAMKLAVNVDMDDGDTRAVEEQQLAHWLDGLGAWEYLDPDASSLEVLSRAQTANIGWPLLWVVLVLVVLETWLARRFSHATAVGQRSWASRFSAAVRQLRAPQRDADSRRSAA